ncbi:MAG TPA: GntR family transcriptional regulator [Streptosporangiaceae bacterium]|jgi:DNA-binding GntR family transcriptional regulator|nr:GntR family transcriptional regulator [Streptosporangiaceae bacterium]
MAATDPVYFRVLEDLRARIRGGLLPPGARVPSRNAIIAKYGVGETAAKHALQVLATEGLIEARTGSGSYVRRVPAACYLDHDRLNFPGSPFGLGEEADPAGRVAWEHQTERRLPPPHIARRLRLDPGVDEVVTTTYLLTADGAPVQVATSYEPGRLTAGTSVALPEQGPLAGRGVIERMASIGIHVDQVVEEVSVRPSLAAEAAALGLPAGTPVLLIERVHLASGQPAEAGEIVIAADRFRLRYRIGVPAADPVPAASHDPAGPALPAMAYAPPGAGVPAARAEPPR